MFHRWFEGPQNAASVAGYGACQAPAQYIFNLSLHSQTTENNCAFSAMAALKRLL